MSGTKRTPIARQPAPSQVTPRALALFTELERAARARNGDGCSITRHGLCAADCPACEAWYDRHAELHVELRLKPWQWPCLPLCPFPPGSAEAREWQPGGEQQALWEMLYAARKAIN
jgi:hypothetical protein